MRILFNLSILVFLFSCGAERGAQLLSLKDSGLSQEIYNVIAARKEAKIDEKNRVIKEVKKAIDKWPQDNAKRAANIDGAVAVNGNYVGWAQDIRLVVDRLHPIEVLERLKTLQESGLDQNVYDAIANQSNATDEQKNKVMQDVKEAIGNNPQDQAKRDADIDGAVAANGAYAGWAQDIKRAVDLAHPIKVSTTTLKTLQESGLVKSVYDVIANHPPVTIEQKNRVMARVKKALNAKSHLLRNIEIDDAVAANDNTLSGWASRIKAAVDLAYAILTEKWKAGLSFRVYDVIANHPKATNQEKNQVMVLIKTAIDKNPNDQAKRDADIRAAVSANGDYAGWAQAIKDEVDNADPIKVGETLKTLHESGLPKDVYDVIANHSTATIKQKNKVMESAKEALDEKKTQFIRDMYIDNGVLFNGDYPGWAAKIKAEVDKTSPIGMAEALKTQSQSGLAQNVYDVIANHTKATNVQKNDVMAGVKKAIDDYSMKMFRDSAIDNAVLWNGKYAGWADKIKAAVDKEYPFVKEWKDSDLPIAIYYVIADHPSATNKQKNNVMDMVKAALKKLPKDQVVRDADIVAAVTANGNYAGWAQAIKVEVDKEDPIGEAEVLLPWHISGLDISIYKVIADHPKATIKQKNTVMAGVRVAIEKSINQNVRDEFIKDHVVYKNGNYPGWAQAIKAAVDKKHPFAEVLKTESESGLHKDVYDVIAGFSGATPKQKNKVMEGVKAAVAKMPQDQDTRDYDIIAAVIGSLGGPGLGWADSIINAVDKVYPIKEAPPEALKSQPESGLSQGVYDVIAKKTGASNKQKNNVMIAVKTAMDKVPKAQALRNDAIEEAVAANGNDQAWAQAIKKAVDKAEPLVDLNVLPPVSAFEGVILIPEAGAKRIFQTKGMAESAYLVKVTKTSAPAEIPLDTILFLHSDKFVTFENVIDYGKTVYFNKTTPKEVAEYLEKKYKMILDVKAVR